MWGSGGETPLSFDLDTRRGWRLEDNINIDIMGNVSETGKGFDWIYVA